MKLKQVKEQDCLHLKKMQLPIDGILIWRCAECPHIFLKEQLDKSISGGINGGFRFALQIFEEVLKEEYANKEGEKMRWRFDKILKKVNRKVQNVSVRIPIKNVHKETETPEDVLTNTIDKFLKLKAKNTSTSTKTTFVTVSQNISKKNGLLK